MGRTIPLSDVETVLTPLEYPIHPDSARNQLDDVTVTLADGEADLADLLDRTTVSEFDSPGDVVTELHNVLPRGAVGEPYQSEGEG